jgi:hypothetical protein
MEDKKKPTFKEIHGKTKLGKFLQENAPTLLQSILGIAGGLIPGASGVTDVIKGMIGNSTELSEASKEQALALADIDFKNVDSARKMQTAIATSAEATIMSKNFVYYIAAFWSLVTAAYIFLITFMVVENTRAADTVLGFLLGTIIATIINYFFGSSQGSKDKMKSLLSE